MSEAKLDVSAISPQTFARAPWNKYHWRITRTAGGKAQPVVTCCVEAKRQDRTCVGFDTRDQAVAAGSTRRAEILAASQADGAFA